MIWYLQHTSTRWPHKVFGVFIKAGWLTSSSITSIDQTIDPGERCPRFLRCSRFVYWLQPFLVKRLSLCQALQSPCLFQIKFQKVRQAPLMDHNPIFWAAGSETFCPRNRCILVCKLPCAHSTVSELRGRKAAKWCRNCSSGWTLLRTSRSSRSPPTSSLDINVKRTHEIYLYIYVPYIRPMGYVREYSHTILRYWNSDRFNVKDKWYR